MGELLGLAEARFGVECRDDRSSAAMRSSRLRTCEAATEAVPAAEVDEGVKTALAPEADADEGVKIVLASEAGGVMEKEGDRVRNVESPLGKRPASSPGSVSIEGRGSSGSKSSPEAASGVYVALLVEGVCNRPELPGLFSFCMLEIG